MLFIASVFDVRSELGDVPDVFPAAAVIGGLGLHAAQSLITGSFEPVAYSIAIGGVFSIYGWFAYWRGMWGGADAFCLSALGFGAPFLTLSGYFTFLHGLNMFFNLVLIASVYALGYSFIKAYKTENFGSMLMDKLKDDRFRISIELLAGAIVFLVLDFQKALLIYALIVSIIFLYRFLNLVEEHGMMEEVSVDELKEGEVIREEGDEKIKGVTEEEIEELEGDVKVMRGLRFVPVFPAALVLTDAGFSLLTILFYL
jgi:hypothetical protein